MARAASARDLVGQHVAEHHHVGLLDHLGPERHLAAEQQVGGHGAGGQGGGIDVVHLVEAGELLVEPGGRVEAVDQGVGHVAPVRELAWRQADALAERGRLLGSPRLEPGPGVEGARDVVARQDVGVGVVVDALVVLVGAHDHGDVKTAELVAARPRGPEARRLEQQLGAHAAP